MKEHIEQLLSEKKVADLRNELVQLNVVDIAHHLQELDRDDLIFVFRILPKDMAAKAFAYVDIDVQKLIVDSILDDEVRSIINKLYLDDTVDFLEEMPANVVTRVLANTDEKKRTIINQILSYPDYSAGSIMTIEYVNLKEDMTVKQALKHIKSTGIDKETINTCYVLDVDKELIGVISIRKLILSNDTDILKDIMNTDFISVNTFDDQEKIVSLFKKYDLLAIPVVDAEYRLVGIVTIDDIVDIIDQEATEDLQKMAAMTPSDQPYLKTSSFTLAKHRIPWLLVLMVSATFSGLIIQRFENALNAYIILASFIPMIMDTGGNAGSQSSTLIIRGLALGEIKNKDFFKVFWKEIQVSLISGIILAFINFLRLIFITKTEVAMALTVSLTLVAVVLLAKTIGGILPLIAKKLKLDPAIMAGPLITTVVDTLALIIYFVLATWLLGIS